MYEKGEGFVPGEGSTSAKLMLIGEAPGADEAAAGRPFVGGAGRLLNALLAEAGIKRSTVFIDNVLRCRPPSNKYPKGKERKDAEQCCRQYDREDVKPNVIVALGEKALNLLTSKKGITRWAGSVIESSPGVAPSRPHARSRGVGGDGGVPPTRKGRKRKSGVDPAPVCDPHTEANV